MALNRGRKQEWTVRVINYREDPHRSRYGRDELPGLWVEQLRYMGHARELATYDDPPRTVLEFYAPSNIDSRVWATQNAERMQSFGINAVPAPKWDDEKFVGNDMESRNNESRHRKEERT